MNSELSHRKAGMTVRVCDRNGLPLKNTKLHLKQNTHEFLFGCGAFPLMPYANGINDSLLTTVNEKWLALYNYGTLPFYWGNFEPEEGKPNTEMLMNTARFMKERGVEIKGHPLCWHTACADWLLKYDTETILKKQLGRIEREVGTFKGVIDMWDVINEVVIMPVFDKYDNAVTRLCKQYGRVGLVKRVFDAAKSANPDARLLINDFNTTDDYRKLIAECLDADVPIDTIGIQSHQHQGYWGKDKLYEVLGRFEGFGLPIHFTENTIISGSYIPPEIEDLNDWQVSEWLSTPEGEERQAEQTIEMYRVLFAHPLVKGITWWDPTDGEWLNAPSGVMRKDGSSKPVYDRLKSLIHDEWTTDCELSTDENGYAEIYGFKGGYMLSADGAGAELTLADGLKECEITLI